MKAKVSLFSFLLLILFHQTILVSSADALTRIMPLGDSITRGSSSGESENDLQISYRKALWDKLVASGYDVDFVGSQNSGSFIFGALDPADHEGHGGWTDDEIVNGRLTDPGAGKLDEWLADHQPDVVLLHIGTNGLDSSPNDVADILDEIDKYSPDTWVILARIINRSIYSSTTTLFNDNVENMANLRVSDPADPAYPDKIIFGVEADMEDGAGINYDLQPAGDMNDNLHPYQYGAGYAKMADVWFDALKQILPLADFTADTISGVYPLTVNFIDQSTGNITSWEWDFGDGSPVSSDQNPTHTYENFGSYSVSLTVTGIDGVDTEIKNDYIVVQYVTPVANFTVDHTSGFAPLTVNFSDASAGAIDTWEWDFGDGSPVSSDQNPTHTYENFGSYSVSLTVTGIDGVDTEIKNDYIVVQYVTPVANFTADKTNGFAPLTVSFSDESTGTIDTREWDFGDGTPISSDQNPMHTYEDFGNYSVSLTVTSAGVSHTKTKTNYIAVYNSAPEEIIGTWSSGIWIRDIVTSQWIKMYSGVPAGAIAAGDFTGDGKADVASIWSSGLWYQNGATLGWTKVSPIAPDRLAAGDITGDGVDEIICSGADWDSGIWYRDVANATWYQPWESTPTGPIAVGDVTGDGKADIISCSSDGLWYQDGATLERTKVYETAPYKVTCGDVTGDGQAEIIGPWANGIWYRDLAESKWTRMYSSVPSGAITAGDFTGDGKADVVSCWSSGLWYQDGATLAWTKVYYIAPSQVTAGNVTGN